MSIEDPKPTKPDLRIASDEEEVELAHLSDEEIREIVFTAHNDELRQQARKNLRVVDDET